MILVMSRLTSLIGIFATTLTATGGQTPAPAGATATVIKAARMLNVKTGTYRTNHALLVADGRIAQAGPAADITSKAPAGATTIDVGTAIVMPGLIDCHAHLLARMDEQFGAGANIIISVTQLGPARRALIGAANAREMLEAGFTTVRNVGHSGVDGDVALKEAIDAGWVPGPRVLASGRKVTPPGGQAVALRLHDQSAILDEEFIPISGADEARRAVGSLLAAGVDVIKIVADDGPRVLDKEEIAAIVTAAHRARIRVAAHATSAAGIQAAINGGVDSIEHGDEATDAMLTSMREKGITLVPIAWTAEALRDVYLAPRAWTDAEKAGIEKQIAAFTTNHAKLVQRAAKAGVKIAAGSDMWMRYRGKTRGEAAKVMLDALARTGIRPADVIRAATVNAAELLGWGDRVGSLEPGRFADVIAVDGDPLTDIGVLNRVTFVMKGGTVIRSQGR
jgi:imidazolonepropionase-like amidohydrolase